MITEAMPVNPASHAGNAMIRSRTGTCASAVYPPIAVLWRLRLVWKIKLIAAVNRISHISFDTRAG